MIKSSLHLVGVCGEWYKHNQNQKCCFLFMFSQFFASAFRVFTVDSK